jgi:ParB/RepB/Spo0J family partition protein
MSKKPNPTIDLGFLQGQAAGTDLSGMFASSVSTESGMQQALMVKIERLLNNPYQPRLEIHEEGIDELAQVVKAQGFQGVLVGRPDPVNKGFYQLTAGHRRREAARRAGLSSLPLVVRELTDEEMITLAITENIQREDLTPLEEGKIYLLMSDEMGYTQEQIAREIGRERGYVVNRLRVARAPRDIQALVQAKPDSLRMVANLIKVKDEAGRAEIIAHILAGNLTVEDLPGYIQSKAAQAEQELTEAAPAEVEATREGGDPQTTASITGLPGTLHRNLPEPPAPPAPASTPPPWPETQQGADATPTPTPTPTSTASMAGGRPGRAPSPAGERPPGNRVLNPETRIGSAKLAAVLRYLRSYHVQAAYRQMISPQERTALAQIMALVEELHDRFDAD